MTEAAEEATRSARLPAVVLAVAVGLVLAVALALVGFTMPVADDLQRGAVGVSGVPAYVVDLYVRWNGRAFSIAVSTLVLSSVDILRFYPLIELALLALLLAAMYSVVGLTLAGTLPRRVRWAVTAVLGAIWWAGAPPLGDSLYWFTGAVDTVGSYAFGALALAGLATTSRLSGRTRWWMGAAIALAAFLVPLSQELPGFQLILLLAATCAAAWHARAPVRGVAIVSLIAAVAGFLINVGAPGNAIRATIDAAPHRHDLGLTLRWTADYLAGEVATWVLDAKVLAASLLVLVHPALVSAAPSWRMTSRWPWQWLAPALLALMLTCAFAGPIYMTGWQRLPNRTVTGIYTTFLFGWLACLAQWKWWWSTRPGAEPLSSTPLSCTAMVVLAAALVFTGNLRVGVSDLRGPAPTWRGAVVQRYAQLRDAGGSGQRQVDIAPLPRPPRLFFQRDATPDPTFWYNTALARYFGLETVRVVSAP